MPSLISQPFSIAVTTRCKSPSIGHLFRLSARGHRRYVGFVIFTSSLPHLLIQSLPSLAICTNAARSSSHVADMSRLRKDGVPVPELIVSTLVPSRNQLTLVFVSVKSVLSLHQRRDNALECLEREAHGIAAAHE